MSVFVYNLCLFFYSMLTAFFFYRSESDLVDIQKCYIIELK